MLSSSSPRKGTSTGSLLAAPFDARHERTPQRAQHTSSDNALVDLPWQSGRNCSAPEPSGQAPTLEPPAARAYRSTFSPVAATPPALPQQLSRQMDAEATRMHLDGLDWGSIDGVHRSSKGKYGVWFLDMDDVRVAVKVAPDIDREYIATQLAALSGLAVAAPFALLHSPPMSLREACDIRPSDTVLVMPRLYGASFAELRPCDKQALEVGNTFGQSVYRSMGEVYAFDSWIGNGDRFPRPQLGVHNRGNLMLTEDGVVCIDNTMSTALNVANPAYLQRYADHLDQVLDGLKRIETGPASPCFSRLPHFFPPDFDISWDTMRVPFMKGLREGLQRIAALSPEVLAAVLTPSGLDAGTLSFLANNLRKFGDAHPVNFGGVAEDQRPRPDPSEGVGAEASLGAPTSRAGNQKEPTGLES